MLYKVKHGNFQSGVGNGSVRIPRPERRLWLIKFTTMGSVGRKITGKDIQILIKLIALVTPDETVIITVPLK